MKTPQEIVRMHDLLVGVIVGDAPSPFGRVKAGDFRKWLNEQEPEVANAIRFQMLQETASVLCWVLNHDHNPTFKENCDRLERWLLEQGFPLVDHSN